MKQKNKQQCHVKLQASFYTECFIFKWKEKSTNKNKTQSKWGPCLEIIKNMKKNPWVSSFKKAKKVGAKKCSLRNNVTTKHPSMKTSMETWVFLATAGCVGLCFPVILNLCLHTRHLCSVVALIFNLPVRCIGAYHRSFAAHTSRFYFSWNQDMRRCCWPRFHCNMQGNVSPASP